MNYLNYPVTLGAILICIIFWIVQYMSSQKNHNDSFLYKYALIPMQVKRGDYYRLITAGFLHVRPYHILMNCFALYNIGTAIEPYLSSGIFAIVLILSIIGGGICCTFLSKQDSLTIGISGGVFGLLAAYIVILYKLDLLSNPSIYTDIIRVLGVNLFISLMPGVSWQGHLGGFLVGLITAFIFI